MSNAKSSIFNQMGIEKTERPGVERDFQVKYGCTPPSLKTLLSFTPNRTHLLIPPASVRPTRFSPSSCPTFVFTSFLNYSLIMVILSGVSAQSTVK